MQFEKRLHLIHIHLIHSWLRASPELIEMLRALLRPLEEMTGITCSIMVPNCDSYRFCRRQDFKEEEVNLSATYMNVRYRNLLAASLFKSFLTVHTQLMVVKFHF